MLPIFEGDDQDRHSQLCWEWSGNRAIRRGNDKLVYDKIDRKWALYDIEVDRSEIHDRSEQVPELAADLEAAWTKWADETGVGPKPKKAKPNQ